MNLVFPSDTTYLVDCAYRSLHCGVDCIMLPVGLLVLSASWSCCFPTVVPETSQITAAQRSSSQGSLGNSTPDIPPRPATRPWSMVHSHDLLSSHNHSNSDVAGSPRYDSSFGKWFLWLSSRNHSNSDVACSARYDSSFGMWFLWLSPRNHSNSDVAGSARYDSSFGMWLLWLHSHNHSNSEVACSARYDSSFGKWF